MSEPAKPKHRNDAKPAVDAAIREHMATQGSHNWNDLFAKLPDVSQGSIWRWIREVKAGPKDSKSRANRRRPMARFDPFGGACTTGLVADQLQRDAILIELNPEYADLTDSRITRDSSLFTEIVS